VLLDYAFDHDALFIHIGHSPQAKLAFSALNSPNIDGLYNDLTYRSKDRVAPHNAYTSEERILKQWERAGYRTEYSDDYVQKFTFNKEVTELESDTIANKVTLPFSNLTNYSPWFEFDSENHVYKRFHMNGAPHIDRETDVQLTFTNIIVQYTDMWVISGDTEGRLDQRLISTGTGYYISNGKSIEITWEKTDHYSPTKYFDTNGNEIVFNPGKSYIAIFPSNKEIIIE
jgi:hypothetical protein